MMEERDKQAYKKITEALLFAVGEPIEAEMVAIVLEIKESEAKLLLNELKDEYDYDMRGYAIIRTQSRYQLSTRSEYFEYVKKLFKKNTANSLSQAALETLAIIAYRQPVTRNDVEYLRGVQSSSSLDLLIDKGVVKSAGKLDVPGKPIAYETTDEFLKLMNITNLNELPAFESFAEGIQMKLSEMDDENTD